MDVSAPKKIFHPPPPFPNSPQTPSGPFPPGNPPLLAFPIKKTNPPPLLAPRAPPSPSPSGKKIKKSEIPTKKCFSFFFVGFSVQSLDAQIVKSQLAATTVALCFLWYRRLSLLHPHFFPEKWPIAVQTGLTRGASQEKLASEAYRAIGGVGDARNSIADRAIVGHSGPKRENRQQHFSIMSKVFSSGSFNQKKRSVHKISTRYFWGRKWLRQFYGRLSFFGSICWKTPCP